MNLSNFFFYDYETFGLHVSLDKICQFAYLITNKNFKILKPVQNMFCYPSLDYFPNIFAILTNKITPQKSLKYGFNEYNFSKKIYKSMLVYNTCFVGFNNIKFDDEITRNLFYRNLYDPYSWNCTRKNTRWDLLHIVRAYYILSPIGIIWPKNKYNLPVFKLKELTKYNCISHLNVHNATSDVNATMLLAKFLNKKNPNLFNYLFKLRKKKKILQLLNIDNSVFLFISEIFGSFYDYVGLIYPLCMHPLNKNILIAVDLMQDLNFLCSIDITNIYDKENITNILLLNGLLFIYINKCPILIPYKKQIRYNDKLLLNLSYRIFKNNLDFVKKQYLWKKNIFNFFSKKKKKNKKKIFYLYFIIF